MTKLQLVQSISDHKDRAWCCAWSHNGKYLATSSADKTVRIYKQQQASSSSSTQQQEEQTWECIDELKGHHTRTIRCISWAPNDSVLACASFDGTVTIWEKRRTSSGGSDNDGGGDDDDEFKFECVSTLEGHENEVKSCSWDSNGQLLATCGRDKTVWIWETLDDCGYSDFDCISVLNGHTQDVKCVLWHPTMEMLLTASYDDTVRSWVEDVDDWYCADICRAHKSTVWSLSCNASGSHMVSVGDDLDLVICRLILKNDEGGGDHDDQDEEMTDKKFMWKECARLPQAHKRTVYSADWAKTGHEMIATAAGDDTIRLFRLKDGSSLSDNSPQFELVCEQLNAHETDLNCVSWNPVNPSLLATVSDDATLKIWKLTE